MCPTMIRTGSVGTFLLGPRGSRGERHGRIAAALAFMVVLGVAPGHAHGQGDTPAGAPAQ